MDFRSFIQKLDKSKELIKVSKPVSKRFEAAAILKALDGKPVLFENIKESQFKVAGNVFSSKHYIADYFGCDERDLIKIMVNALNKPKELNIIKKSPCQDIIVEEKDVDLDKLPILRHTKIDGGNYITSGVFIAKDKELGMNASFHRCMQLDKKTFSVRVCERNLYEFLQRASGELNVAVCIGNPASVLLAGATSPPIGQFEFEIASALESFGVVKAQFADVYVPSSSEFIIEGTLTMNELANEGMFLDLTGTRDFVRKQPILKVKRITHRKNAIWHALLPGGNEHGLLMGMPREPTIFSEVSKVAKCLNVNITQGGCSWLHAVVQVQKESDEQIKRVIEAAFKGHSSLKHVFVVDADIDANNMQEVEWAFATRLQGDKQIHIFPKQKGSSLDPSAEHPSRITCKVGFDLTIPMGRDKADFTKVNYERIELDKYLVKKDEAKQRRKRVSGRKTR
ncbi:MAG: UbiD family decarboxylase [Candidatus Diapherotrites archaeon]|nr:UbiD family decarboxylase [Candidatus Diapherotrites archaeon]